jgi:hypothetical protein
MSKKQSILTEICSCGETISSLKVSGNIKGGTTVSPNACWRCKQISFRAGISAKFRLGKKQKQAKKS